MKHFVGCSGFHYRDWKKTFYPEKLPQKRWFEYYSSQFNTLELNVTFYRFPQLSTLEQWYAKSPDRFCFAMKVPRLITHYKKFNDTEKLLDDFYTTARKGLREKLGPILFQLPGQIVYDENMLERTISAINEDFINAIEFRHESWWKPEVFSRLAKKNIIFCSASFPKLPDDIIQNTSTIYYRYHGVPKLYYSEYPEKQVKKIAEKIKHARGIDAAYIYFNNTATLAAINNARQMNKFLENH